MKAASPAESRVTLRFGTESGREYLYDDETGSILPWSPLRERVLSSLLAGRFGEERSELEAEHGAAEVEAARAFLEHWRDDYGAFVRRGGPETMAPIPPAEELRRYIAETSFELLLILTENCNLRCRYCALSEVYPLNRWRTQRTMSFETARDAIDWYYELTKGQLERNPRKRMGLSLYGGEPTMNMPLLKRILEYVRDRYPETFLPVMTTNGTLLTPKNVPVLVEHGVQLAISLDGTEEEHDRLRVDSRDRGTHAQIMKNLRWIQEHYPEWFKTKLTTVSVYDQGSDVVKSERFFAENEGLIPRSVFVNAVGERNTDYHAQYTEEDTRRIAERVHTLRERYKEAKVKGEPTSSYMMSLVGMPIAMGVLRNRVADRRPGFLPYTGTCVPGDKIAVHVEGKIDMCERVNGTYPIGHLDQGGIDYERLREIIGRYRDQVMTHCHRCPASKFCSVCFSHVEGEGDFARIASACAGTITQARGRLADYTSVMERNRDADFIVDTDVSYLEQRMLYGY